jgi:ABC-type dipeptide/oligopeptide/nickel transport system permease subunit
MSLKNKKVGWEIKVGGLILFFYVIWALVWMFIRSFIKGSPTEWYEPMMDIKLGLSGPLEFDLIWGSDIYGRSLFELVSNGLNYSLLMALLVSILAMSIGIIIGYLMVKGPSWLNLACDLLTNIIFIFPSILIAIMVMTVTGQSLWGLVLVLVFTGWPAYARIARGEIIRIMALPYVEGAKAVGVNNMRLFWTIIIPGIMPTLMVHFVLGVSGVIISESVLGFLGLGGSEYSWGALLGMAKSVLLESPSMVLILSINMAGLIIGLNLLGDGLRDYFDPKSS